QGSRNQPGMVVAVHIDAGDFVKVKGQVFEVEETDFDDHDVTLWFVGGNALKCSAGCPVEVVSAPVATDIKVKES
ncbi:Ead protein, partial [Salmonella enterica subsp. enterica serovar Blockley]|nr:Ead protein [Salmonella enterica subsp. enterica serovar Blockley]